jgi:hypothetical protein
VLGADGCGQVGEAVDAAHDPLAHRRMLEHRLPLLSGQVSAFLEDRVGDADLSYVVEQGDLLDLDHLLAGEPEALGYRCCEAYDGTRVLAGVLVAGLERGHQGADPRQLELGAMLARLGVRVLEQLPHAPGEESHQLGLTLREVRPRARAQRAQRAVQAAIGEAQGHADKAPEPAALADVRQPGDLRLGGRVDDDVRGPPFQHPVTQPLREGQLRSGVNAEPGAVSVDGPNDLATVDQLAQERDLHAQLVARAAQEALHAHADLAREAVSVEVSTTSTRLGEVQSEVRPSQEELLRVARCGP